MKNLTSGELSWQDPIPTAGNKGDHFDCQQRHNSEQGAPQLHKRTCTDRKHSEKQPCSERQSQSITNSYFVLFISEKHVCCEWLRHFSGSLANNAASQHHTTYTQIISPLYGTQGNFTTLWGDIRAYFCKKNTSHLNKHSHAVRLLEMHSSGLAGHTQTIHQRIRICSSRPTLAKCCWTYPSVMIIRFDIRFVCGNKHTQKY